MSLSLVQSRALVGLQAAAVTVEVHLANGLPNFMLVGLADTEVKEARERVRSAILNCGLDFPHNRRITVNLAPADLPKDSGRLDLPIALGILAASGQLDARRLAGYEFAGELSLSGELRPVRGALAMSLALHAAGARAKLVLPPGSAEEAALVPGALVYRAGHLLEVVRQFLPESATAAAADQDWTPLVAQPLAAAASYPDLADVKGQAGAKRALEIAAAGSHSVLMLGPPGSGKSMLAQRFAGLLPPMSVDEALESAAIASLAGQLALDRWGIRPTCSPHHTASAVALVGGGSPPRPGEISLAHHGVLFMDELAEFPRAALEALREPLETGRITISRAARRAEFPAQLPVHRRHESLPLRLAGRGAPLVPLHARPGGPLPGQVERPLARSHRPARRSAGTGGRGTAHGAGRGMHRSDPGPLDGRARARAGAPGQAEPGAARKGDRPARRPGRRRGALPAPGGGAPGLERAIHPSRAEGRPHHRRPRRRAHAQVEHVAEAVQYRRGLVTAP